MTGNDVYNLFLNKIDKSYSKFIDPIKLNRFFRMSLTNLLDKKYVGLVTQKEYDELRSVISTEKVFAINNSKIPIAPISIKSITNTGLLVIVETLLEHNISDNQIITISGVQGLVTTPSINGQVTVFNSPTLNTFTFPVTFISGSYIPNTGVITYDNMIDDYLHLSTIRCKIPQPMRGLYVTNTSNRTPCIVTFNKPNNLATGEMVSISGSPNTTINGTFYYESLTDKRGRLWNDARLTNPVISNDNNQSGGKISRIFYNYAEPLYSDRKISDFEVSEAYSPTVQTADSFLKFHPDCMEITIDYISKPKVYIDCQDSSFDIELIYPAKFLYLLVDETILLYTSPSRDMLLAQLTTKDITP